MPGDSTRNTLARQWELLRLLPGRGAGKSARELAEALNAQGYKVSKRQVERDLGDLSSHFPIDCNDRSQPYGWRWVPGASIDIPGVSLAEALSLHLIEETVKPLLPSPILDAVESRFRQAARKLASQPRNQRYARWPAKVRVVAPILPFVPPAIDPEVLEQVQSALLDEVQLEVWYRSARNDDYNELTLHPIALVQQGMISYLIAMTFDYTDIRIYTLHRMREARAVKQRARKPEEFDLDAYIGDGKMHFGTGEPLRLKARLSHDLARILEETPLSEDQKITETRTKGKDGKPYVLTATVRHSWRLVWWVLSQGDGVEVVGPAGFRREIAGMCKSMAEQYSG